MEDLLSSIPYATPLLKAIALIVIAIVIKVVLYALKFLLDLHFKREQMQCLLWYEARRIQSPQYLPQRCFSYQKMIADNADDCAYQRSREKLQVKRLWYV